MSKKTVTLYEKDGVIKAKAYQDGEVTGSAEAAADDKNAIGMILPLTEGAESIICPGGVLKPLKRGLYEIDENALSDAKSGEYGRHSNNDLMALCADIAKQAGIKAYMLDPMSSDELLMRARVSSNADIPKCSRYYALEHAAAIDAVASKDCDIAEDQNYIVACVDRYVSVGAHERCACIDVNDMIGLEGPMGLCASGDVPVAQLSRYYQKSGLSADEMIRVLSEESGLAAYIGTADPSAIDGLDKQDDLDAVDTFVYQISKWIGNAALMLKGDVRKIILTGSAAASERVTDGIIKRVQGIAPVEVLKDPDVERYLADAAETAGSFIYPVLKY